MPDRSLILPIFAVLWLVAATGPARAQDVAICFDTADKVVEGETIGDEVKRAGHEACQRALAATSSVVQKYHLQEADFDIIGRPPKSSN